jgi:hypothetical protein
MVSNMENRGARNLIIQVTLNRAARIKFAQIFRFKSSGVVARQPHRHRRIRTSANRPLIAKTSCRLLFHPQWRKRLAFE